MPTVPLPVLFFSAGLASSAFSCIWIIMQLENIHSDKEKKIQDGKMQPNDYNMGLGSGNSLWYWFFLLLLLAVLSLL